MGYLVRKYEVICKIVCIKILSSEIEHENLLKQSNNGGGCKLQSQLQHMYTSLLLNSTVKFLSISVTDFKGIGWDFCTMCIMELVIGECPSTCVPW